MTERKRGTSRGAQLADSLIEELAKEAERGYDVHKLRPRRRGRPPLGAEAAEVFQVRLDRPLRDLLDATVSRTGVSASELARRALRSYLRSLRTGTSDHSRRSDAR